MRSILCLCWLVSDKPSSISLRFFLRCCGKRDEGLQGRKTWSTGHLLYLLSLKRKALKLGQTVWFHVFYTKHTFLHYHCSSFCLDAHSLWYFITNGLKTIYTANVLWFSDEQKHEKKPTSRKMSQFTKARVDIPYLEKASCFLNRIKTN